MLSSALDVIDLEGRNHGDEIRVGGFDLIHAGGSNTSWTARTGARGSLYTTALGTEIPQQRVERMPRPSESSSLPPSGPGGGNGADGSARRHTASSFSGAAAAAAGGGGTGATGGEGGGGGGGAGGGGSAASPSKTPARGAGVGGGSGTSTGSGSSRSSSSMARSTRTSSSDSLPRETANRGEGRAGRSDAGVRGASRGGDRSGSGRDVGGGNGAGAGARVSGGAKCARNADRDSIRDLRDRGDQRAGGKDKSNRDRGSVGCDPRGEAMSASGPAEDVLARSLPPTRRGSASTDTEKLLAMPSRKGIHSS